MITRKDLNQIAKAFNMQLKSCTEQITQTSEPIEHIRIKIINVFEMSRVMFLILEKINPKMDYYKWRKAILEDQKYAVVTLINKNFGTVPTQNQ